MNERWVPTSTHAKYAAIYEKVKRMKLRDKRDLFACMRGVEESDYNWYAPSQGVTAGIFAFFHVLSECPRRRGASTATTTT
jgi:hypothetical protein